MSTIRDMLNKNTKGGSHMKHTHSAHSSFFAKLLAVVLLCSLVGGAFAAGSTQSALAEEADLSMADIYEQNVNSTVGITISAQAQTESRYGYGYTYEASGSGFIYSEDGYILTNYHVIEGYEKVTVATYDGSTYDAKVIGYDESNDIAVLKIEAEGLTPVTLGDSSSLRVGDAVLAIGNPLGELTFSLTHGIVSALSRNVTIDSGNTMTLIQTDCSINSGNSGGALFNMKGEVIGITNAKYSSSGYSGEASIDNIGFAIPINSVKRIVSSIIENGYIVKPYVGITISSLSEEQASVTGIEAGAWVREVTEGAPADKAGIKVNDIIVKVDDTVIRSSDDLVSVVSSSEPDEVLHFYIYRQGQELEVDVTIEAKTESALKNEEAAAAAEEDAQNGSNQPPESKGSQGQQSQEDFYNYFFGDGNGMNDFFNYYFGYGN